MPWSAYHCWVYELRARLDKVDIFPWVLVELLQPKYKVEEGVPLT